MRWLWLAFVAFPPAMTRADVVFFDDFEGNALLPHWNQPPPSHWGYNVSNSMLNLTGLFYPSSPKSPSNFAAVGALFDPQSDFQVDAWMGWEAGQQPHRLALEVNSGPTGTGILADFRYDYEGAFGPNPVILAGAGNQGFSMPAPPPGIYHFTVSRTATQYRFFLNDSLLWVVAGSSAPATGVSFFFLGPYPAPLGPLHVDRVQVVPVPSVLCVIAISALARARRRRRG